jgi:DnaK suppressor protein
VAKAKKKPVAKKPVKKAASKKAVAKKAAPKKPAPKKELAKKAPVKKAVEKKLLAPAVKVGVKPSAASGKRQRITVIKAPTIVVAKPGPTSSKKSMQAIIVPNNYEPSDKEEFMSPVMREYFRRRLLAWRDELLRESEETLHILQAEGNMQKPDITDRASEETDLAIEFRTRDRERKLLNKINEAIGRIEDNSYGYCEETGDPIPVKRLIARPTATMTLEAQELHERRERTQRDQWE